VRSCSSSGSTAARFDIDPLLTLRNALALQRLRHVVERAVVTAGNDEPEP
jgi:hypothetical protein